MPRPFSPRRVSLLVLVLAVVAAAVGVAVTFGEVTATRDTGDKQPAAQATATPQAGPPSAGAVTASGTAAAAPSSEAAPGAAKKGWFGGYADVTLQPLYAFDGTAVTGKPVLAFVIADPENPCEPSWGGQHTLEQAADALHLDQRVALLRQQGQGLAISFGGAAGKELATTCTDQQALAQAYKKVIDRYGPDVIDFDIEARNLSDDDATARRAQAIHQVLEDERSAHPLQVWLTLPVTQKGLDADASAVVRETLRAGIDLAGVNIMTMDYEEAVSGSTMLEASIQAANNAHGQLAGLFNLPQGQNVWNKLGLTPMIGANDIEGETFDLQAAQGLNKFVHDQGIGRLSMWSLNRDQPCTPGQNAMVKERGKSQASDTCSGIGQDRGAFAGVLSAGL